MCFCLLIQSTSLFFYTDPATTEIYTLSLHDALPIFRADNSSNGWTNSGLVVRRGQRLRISASGRVSLGNNRYSTPEDRKSTRLNSSHVRISYAVFCLKKKTKQQNSHRKVNKIKSSNS